MNSENNVLIETENAMYALKEDEGLLYRFRKEDGFGGHMGDPLRQDSEPIPYKLLSPLEIGQPMIFELKIRDDGVPTIRTTSHVLAIIRSIGDAEE
jgi:hypothetical protein